MGKVGRLRGCTDLGVSNTSIVVVRQRGKRLEKVLLEMHTLHQRPQSLTKRSIGGGRNEFQMRVV